MNNITSKRTAHLCNLLFIHMKAGRALDRQPCFPLYMPDFVNLSESTWADFLPVAELGAVESPQQPHIPVRRIQGVHISERNPTCCLSFGSLSEEKKNRRRRVDATSARFLLMWAELFLKLPRYVAPPVPQVPGERCGLTLPRRPS